MTPEMAFTARSSTLSCGHSVLKAGGSVPVSWHPRQRRLVRAWEPTERGDTPVTLSEGKKKLPSSRAVSLEKVESRAGKEAAEPLKLK